MRSACDTRRVPTERAEEEAVPADRRTGAASGAAVESHSRPPVPAQVRRWALEAGMSVGDRGPLPPAVLSAYLAEHDPVQPSDDAPPERLTDS
jgi:hypothetical protein